MNTACAPQSKRLKPQPHGRKNPPMVTPKPKRIAPPITKPGRGAKKNDSRVIVRHDDKSRRIDRQNGDIGPGAHNNLSVALQVPEIPRLLALPLHSIHDVLLLR